ncbi:MAG: tRNA epoxyqueuosine(34) reductase QueG [Anaerolineales bacterium]
MTHQVTVSPQQVQEWADEEALDAVGIVPVGPTPRWEAYRAWVAQGYAGGMSYLARADALARRADPREILPAARSMLVVAASYAGPSPPELLPLHGRVSRYAGGYTGGMEDYHRWLLRRLEALVGRIRAAGGPFPYRCYVDTGPVMERAWAEAAGLGWIGKNTNLIHAHLGSFLFLGVALLGVELPPTPSSGLPDCGTCTRCIEACPTGAIVAPRVIDARRCLSYLTIEHRGPIPAEMRPLMGDRVFGCDVCQEVCPWNRRPLARYADAPPPAHATLALPPLLALDQAAFRARFRATPIWRATPDGLARNAAVVLGNLGDLAARPALERAAASHPSAMVREHAAWALARLS